MENIIRIKKAAFYGYHGVFTEEQNMGGKFEADVDIYTNFTNAAEHDSLKETIDYGKVYEIMNKAVLEKKHRLIETLATQIADELMCHYTQINKIAIRVRKNNPPLGGVVDYVEVEIIKTRDEYNKTK